jgi:hypothetical protein
MMGCAWWQLVLGAVSVALRQRWLHGIAQHKCLFGMRGGFDDVHAPSWLAVSTPFNKSTSVLALWCVVTPCILVICTFLTFRQHAFGMLGTATMHVMVRWWAAAECDACAMPVGVILAGQAQRVLAVRQLSVSAVHPS